MVRSAHSEFCLVNLIQLFGEFNLILTRDELGSEFGWLFVSKLGPLFDDVVTSASENVILVYIIIVCGGRANATPIFRVFRYDGSG